MTLYRKRIGGGEDQRVLESDTSMYAGEWLTDGSLILLEARRSDLLPHGTGT